jgi:hypothetical protein
MEINKIRIDGRITTIDYTTESGDYRIKTGEDPSPDLYNAIKGLRGIFLKRMQFEPVKERVMVNGFESGVDNVRRWYKISGIYTANMIGHKITTPKVMEMNDPEFWENNDPDEFIQYLDQEESEYMEKAVDEAILFVQGKREQLPLEDTERGAF